MLPLNAITIRPLPVSGQGGIAPVPVGTFEGRVIQAAHALAVRVGSMLITLPENAPFVAGQAVTVTKPAPDAAVEIRQSPIQSSATSQGGNSIGTTLNRVLSELQVAAGRNPEGLAPLVPGSAPLAVSQVHQLIALFTVRGALGADLAALAAHLQSALASGWTAPEWLRSFIQLAGARPESEPDAIVQWLKQTYASATKTPEGSLAATPPEDAFEGLLAQLRALRNDPALRSALEAANRWSAFAAHADTAIDRLEARALHQLHALDIDYVFAELPAPFSPDFSNIQFHWFRQGNAQSGGSDQVILDLNVSQLGDIWIAIQSGHGHCRCVVRAVSEPAVQVLGAEASALESALQETYALATVKIERWNGDRLAAAAQLMRGATGLDLNA